MAKNIQSFEAKGYVLGLNATGFRGASREGTVVFSSNGRHCNIFHPTAGGDPSLPINTFTVTSDRSLLKIPRTFNNNPDYDPRPKGHMQKLNLRDQIVAFWSRVEGRQLTDLRKIEYPTVIERNLRDCVEEIYEQKGLDEYEQLTVTRTDPAFTLLMTRTPFLAGVQKMLDEYADKFPGKRIESCEFDPVGGFAIFDFSINLT